MAKLEKYFQAKLIQDIYSLLPGCVVLKNDPSYIQGFPDLLVLYEGKWAALECKRSYDAPRQPNQDDWVINLNLMSFARFIYPENREAVLRELQSALQS